MNYIEKILNDFEDDFGPSATVQESRPMFNERTQFDKGGVAKVKEYVQSLPKNTVVTRKLIQDFIDSNDVNVNFQNLFTKNRPAYVGNFTKDKSITIDSSYPTGSKRYKKAKAIINDPKLKKEFIKFGNQKGISINDIREKFNIGREEFYEGGLRELFDKDFQLQQASKLKPKTINNITALLNDKEASSFLKKGQVVPDEILTKLKIAPSEAATATVRIGQIYGGNKFDEKAFKNTRTNVKASNNLFNTMNKFAFGNPYRSKLYNASLELIDEQLGNEKGTFASLKKKASYILKKNKIKGFDINEIAGVSGTAKSGAGEFSQFIDVMDSNLNQKQMASFQSAFSQARQNIANNPNNFEAESKRINKLASRFEREYGVKLPRIRDVGDVEKYYSANRLKNLSDQGLDIKKASKNVGYTIQMPKGAKTINEFLTPKHQQLIKNQFCPGNKVGGPPGSCDISEAMDNMLKQTNAVKQGAIKGTEATRIAQKASKVARFGTGKGLGAVLGPLGLAGEAVFEVAMAVPGYGKGKKMNRILGDSILGLIPGVGQSAEEEFDEYATKDGMSQLEQQKIKDANRFLELNNSLPSALKNIGKGGRGNPLAGSQIFEKQYNEYEPLYNQFVGGPPSESASTALAEQRRINDLIKADEAIRAKKRNIAMDEDFMAAGGGIAKMAGDRSGPPPVSGPQPQGLSYLFNRVKKV
jgi:hypothetical protein